MKIRSGIRRAAVLGRQGLNHLLWPTVCISCGESIFETGGGGLCRGCWEELLGCTGGDYCRRCGRDVSRYALVEGACGQCVGKELTVDGIARAGVYGKSLKDMDGA